jgi:hypothetical protein
MTKEELTAKFRTGEIDPDQFVKGMAEINKKPPEFTVAKAVTDRLHEIKEEIKSLANEALSLVRRSGNRLEYDRSKCYWHPHVVMAVTNDHDYIGGSMASLEDVINALEG